MTVPFAWFLDRAEEWSSPPFLPLLLLFELPLIFSLVYVSRAHAVRAAEGAGIAFASSFLFSLSVPLQYFGTVMAIWDMSKTYVNLVALKQLFPYLLASSVALAIAAFPAGRGQRRSFFAGAAVARVYDVLATDGVAEDRREGSIHDLHHGLALADRGKTPEDLLL